MGDNQINAAGYQSNITGNESLSWAVAEETTIESCELGKTYVFRDGDTLWDSTDGNVSRLNATLFLNHEHASGTLRERLGMGETLLDGDTLCIPKALGDFNDLMVTQFSAWGEHANSTYMITRHSVSLSGQDHDLIITVDQVDDSYVCDGDLRYEYDSPHYRVRISIQSDHEQTSFETRISGDGHEEVYNRALEQVYLARINGKLQLTGGTGLELRYPDNFMHGLNEYYDYRVTEPGTCTLNF